MYIIYHDFKLVLNAKQQNENAPSTLVLCLRHQKWTSLCSFSGCYANAWQMKVCF